jgi:hypothetical protein
MAATDAIPDADVRSQTYFVARAIAQCWHCGLSTRVLALAMPRTHETLDTDAPGSAGDGGELAQHDWHCAEANAFLFYVDRLSDDVQRRLHGLSRHYRPARSAATQSIHWANHCEQCGELLGDHELHCEPDGAFAPPSEAAAANIELLHIDAPLQAAASGYALEPEFFSFMRRS